MSITGSTPFTADMSRNVRTLAELLRQDPRYKREAYAFVFEALRFAHEQLQFGRVAASELPAGHVPDPEESASPQKHLTGQELCEAIRLYALDQYGLMAKCVLNNWGVHSTGDFGEIVFNLIRIGEMRKTKSDRREDFDNVFDFKEGLRDRFQIELPKS